jgi:hypothetical protein
LKPQAGQRQTACMRYISAEHRSQSILASLSGAVTRAVVDRLIVSGEIGRTGWGGAGSDIAAIMASFSSSWE